MGFLAIVGIVSTVLALCAVIFLLLRFLFRGGRGADTPRRAALPAPAAWPEDRYRLLHGKRVSKFYGRYKKLYEQAPIPPDAAAVVKCSSVFSLRHVPVEHYIWIAGDSIYYFPKWESVAAYFLDPEYIHPHRAGDEDVLCGWKIPVSYLIHYETDADNGITRVEYENRKGKRLRAVFLEGGALFFKTRFPALDYALLERREYLGSYKSIKDMSSQMSKLKETLEQGGLTAEEYETARRHIMQEF